MKKISINIPNSSKNFYNLVYSLESRIEYADANNTSSRLRVLRSNTEEWLKNSGLLNQRNAKILEIGCGVALLSNIHSGWHGCEYSTSAVERAKQMYGSSLMIVEADAMSLPYTNEYFDGIYTWATLEHVQNPDKALMEIDRVLKKGGHALIAPAWNCRSWTVDKLIQRSFSELTITEKINRLTIPLRDSLFYRAIFALPHRIYNEIKMLFGISSIQLLYKRLNPRWDLIKIYGHVADDDAMSDIDIHSAITFFRSRRYKIISHKGLFKRLFSRSGMLKVVKYG